MVQSNHSNYLNQSLLGLHVELEASSICFTQREYFFTKRIVPHRNILPENVVNARSVNMYKKDMTSSQQSLLANSNLAYTYAHITLYIQFYLPTVSYLNFIWAIIISIFRKVDIICILKIKQYYIVSHFLPLCMKRAWCSGLKQRN